MLDMLADVLGDLMRILPAPLRAVLGLGVLWVVAHIVNTMSLGHHMPGVLGWF